MSTGDEIAGKRVRQAPSGSKTINQLFLTLFLQVTIPLIVNSFEPIISKGF